MTISATKSTYAAFISEQLSVISHAVAGAEPVGLSLQRIKEGKMNDD
ncbi:hypothetical protein [uncultured Nostoc sp.]|nr:hypothetical protein [uncultured Nostoc sp.]